MSMNFLANLYSKIINEDDRVSLPVSWGNTLFDRHSISNYVRPYEFHKKNNSFHCNDGYEGYLIEVTPKIRMGEETANIIAEILEILPHDVLLSIQMMGLENNEDYLQTWEREHKLREDTNLNNLVDTMSDFLRSKAKNDLTDTLKSNLKSYRVFFCIKVKERKAKKAVVHFLDEVMTTLKSSQLYPYMLDEKELLPVFQELLNYNEDYKQLPKYTKSKYYNKQTTYANQYSKEYAGYFKIGAKKDNGDFQGKYWKALVFQDLDEEIDIGDMGQKIGNTFGSHVNHNQFRNSFIISLNITRATKSELGRININQKILRGKARGKNETEEEKQKIKEERIINNKLVNEMPFFKTDIVVMISGNSYEELKDNTSVVKSFWRKSENEAGGIRLESANEQHRNLFLSSLPLGLTDEYFTKIQASPYFWTSDMCSQFMPLETGWRGNHPHILGITRRNQLMGFDLFKTDGSMNAFVVGASGAGKSVLLNYIAFCHYTRNGRCFIIDIGASYENLVNTVEGGQFLQPDMKNPISFNAFGSIDTKEKLEEYRPFLSSWLYLIGGNKEEKKFKEEQKFIKAELEKIIPIAWQEAKDNGEIPEPTHIQDKFFELAKSEDDRRYSDFAKQLSPICKGGTYHKFYTGVTKFDITKSDMVCLDLTLIQKEEDLRDSLIFVMTYFFSEAVYKGDMTKEIMFLIDEFHKHLGKNPNLDQEVDEAYRTYRKHNGAIINGTQGFSDYVSMNGGTNTNKVGQVVLTNSEWGFFGKQKQVARNMVFNSGLYDFDNADKDAIKNNRTVKGEFSEFMVNTPDEVNIPVRFVFPREFILLVTTDPDEKAMINQVAVNNDISKLEAIKIIAEQEKDAA